MGRKEERKAKRKKREEAIGDALRDVTPESAQKEVEDLLKVKKGDSDHSRYFSDEVL